MNLRLFLPFCTLALFVSLPAFGQAADVMPEPTAAVDDDAPAVGIYVSGEWTLTVYEADGTLVERRAFHNALVPSGGSTLVSLLTRGSSPGLWTVIVIGSDGPCETTDGAVHCGMRHPDAEDPLELANYFPNLSITAIDDDGDAGGLDDTVLLQGSFTAALDDDLTDVRTSFDTCASSTDPDNCTPAPSRPFSAKTLSSPLSVQAGQVVQVEVKIGFSSAAAATLQTSAAN